MIADPDSRYAPLANEIWEDAERRFTELRGDLETLCFVGPGWLRVSEGHRLEWWWIAVCYRYMTYFSHPLLNTLPR